MIAEWTLFRDSFWVLNLAATALLITRDRFNCVNKMSGIETEYRMLTCRSVIVL